MSIQAISWALTLDIPSRRKFVLVALCNYVDQAGGCWPSQKRLAADVNMGETTVRNHLKQLEEEGWIVRQRRYREGYRTTDYIQVRIGTPANATEQPGTSYRQESPVEPYRQKSPTLPAETGELTGRNERPYRQDLPGEPSGTIKEPSDPLEIKVAKKRPQRYPESFEKIWQPIHSEKIRHRTNLGTKEEAFLAWQKHAKDVDPEFIVSQWTAYVAECRYNDHGSKNFFRWLKYRGWETDYEPPPDGKAMVTEALRRKWLNETAPAIALQPGHGETD